MLSFKRKTIEMFLKNCNLKLALNFISFTTLLTLIFSPARSDDLELAEAYVQNLSGQIIEIVENEDQIKEKHEQLHGLFIRYASTVTISRAALGSKWRSLDQSTRKKFTEAFTFYLVQKYGRQFKEFSGAKLAVVKSVDVGRRGVLVHSRLIMPATSPISVKWQVWKIDGSFKLLDIIIEDISMLSMEREEVKNRLATYSGNIKLLIKDLKNK